MIDRSRVNELCFALELLEENGRCSSDHIIQWRINRNVILYKEHVSLFLNTNNNKNSAFTLLCGNSPLLLCFYAHTQYSMSF